MTIALSKFNSQEKRRVVDVRISGIGTAVPPFRVTQKEVHQFVSNHFDITPRTKALYKKTLGNDAIETRFFALNALTDVLEKDRDKINRRFKKEAVQLSCRAFLSAVQNASLQPRDIDFLAVSTCTGYCCPGLSSFIIDEAGLRTDVRSADIVGMGCGAAFPAMEQAFNFVTAHPDAAAAVVSTEICSAAMFSNNEPDIVISNTLFSDGSAAVILTNKNRLATEAGLHPRIQSFESLIVPAWRDTLRFTTENGYLKNILGKDVPQQAAHALASLTKKILIKEELTFDDISHWIFHSGGGKILDSIEKSLGLPSDALSSSRAVLKNFGNMSSPTVLFVLEEERKQSRPGTWGIMASFGAGFSAHAALLQWNE
jgi:predicted naringenin-chalcone synthase